MICVRLSVNLQAARPATAIGNSIAGSMTGISVPVPTRMPVTPTQDRPLSQSIPARKILFSAPITEQPSATAAAKRKDSGLKIDVVGDADSDENPSNGAADEESKTKEADEKRPGTGNPATSRLPMSCPPGAVAELTYAANKMSVTGGKQSGHGDDLRKQFLDLIQ